MKINTVLSLLGTTFFVTLSAMESKGRNLTHHQIKKAKQIIKRWEGREQFIERLFQTAEVSSDAVPFRTIDAELIAIINYREREVTTYYNEKTALTTSYASFLDIITHKEEYKKMHKGSPLNKSCFLQ